MSGTENPHCGKSLDEFLAEEGVRETAKAEASRAPGGSHEEMERQGVAKAALAERMHDEPRLRSTAF